MATLLHDIGKGYPDSAGSRKNHSQSGSEMAARVLPRLGYSHDEIEEVQALILEHLTMYHVATRRDVDAIARAQ